MKHDLEYSICEDDKKCKNEADKKMVKALDYITSRKRQWRHAGVRNAIAAKQNLVLVLIRWLSS